MEPGLALPQPYGGLLASAMTDPVYVSTSHPWQRLGSLE